MKKALTIFIIGMFFAILGQPPSFSFQQVVLTADLTFDGEQEEPLESSEDNSPNQFVMDEEEEEHRILVSAPSMTHRLWSKPLYNLYIASHKEITQRIVLPPPERV